MDFANRKRHEYVGSELECSEQDSKKFPSRSRGQVDFLFAGRVTFKVARYSFSRSIPPKFERKLRRHKQGFGKIDTTVVLNKDENLS